MNGTQYYYYGCDNLNTGHYLFDTAMNSISWRIAEKIIPWGNKIDGGLCVKSGEIQGKALLHYKDGWTCLSFWDRSIDKRYGSNSNFITDRTISTFVEMVDLMKAMFPKIWKRYTFDVVFSGSN